MNGSSFLTGVQQPAHRPQLLQLFSAAMLRNRALASLLALALSSGVSAQYSATYQASPTGLPDKTENGQTGTNKCGTDSNQNSQCQNAYLNSIDDFCLWAPPGPQPAEIGSSEAVVVSYCTKGGRGTRYAQQEADSQNRSKADTLLPTLYRQGNPARCSSRSSICQSS